MEQQEDVIAYSRVLSGYLEGTISSSRQSVGGCVARWLSSFPLSIENMGYSPFPSGAINAKTPSREIGALLPTIL